MSCSFFLITLITSLYPGEEGSVMISLEIEVWKSIPKNFKIRRNRSSKSVTLNRGGRFKHLFRRTEMDKEHYNLMKAFLEQFSRKGEFPFNEIKEMV